MKPMSLNRIIEACKTQSMPLPHDAFAAFVDHVQERGYQYGSSELASAWCFFLDGWKLSRAHVIKAVQTFTEGLTNG